jgi:EmrB/QacA subfamily drug resistance transporter
MVRDIASRTYNRIRRRKGVHRVANWGKIFSEDWGDNVTSDVQQNPPLQVGASAVRPEILTSAKQTVRLRTVMAGVLLAMSLAALDQNIVNTALPRMAAELGGMTHLSWVVTAFMLTSTTTTPIYGKLSDIYGRRALFFIAISVFLVGSLLCGAAQSMTQLIGFRALQGLGAGGLLVLAQAAIGDVVSPRERPRYQGLFTGTFALSSVAGPLLGGFITSAFSWRWVFYVNLPVGLLALVMIAIGLNRPPSGQKRSIDFLGSAWLTGGTATLLLWLAWGGQSFPWVSMSSLGLLGSTVAFGALFVRQENRAAEPLIRLALFRNVIFARGVTVGGMMAFAMLGSTVFLPLYFQLVLGMSPATAGVMLLPQVVGMLLSSVVGGRIVSRLGRTKSFLLAGLVLEAGALASLAILAYVGAAPVIFLFSMAALGLGMGIGMPNLTTAVQNAVNHRELGAATGAMSFTRSLGGALGVATSGAIMSARLAAALRGSSDAVDLHALIDNGVRNIARLSVAQQTEISFAYRTALTGCFMLSGIVMTVALLLVLGLPEQTLRDQIEDGSTAR